MSENGKLFVGEQEVKKKQKPMEEKKQGTEEVKPEVTVIGEAKEKKVERKVSKKAISLWQAPTIEVFAEAVGKTLTSAEIQEAMKKLTVKTIYGDIDMAKYDQLVAAKMFEYVKYGIAKRIWKMMQKQDSAITTDDLLTMLLEMSRMEIEYGLRPLMHIIPVAGQLYVKAEGFLYYAKRSGHLKELKWEDEEKNGVWTSRCMVTTTDGAVFEGIATVHPTSNRMDDPREKARTKAMRRALRRAFPVGGTDEIYDEVTQKSYQELSSVVNGKVVEDLSELKE